MFRKELTYYFSTPIAYIVIGLYLLAISLFLWVIPGQWNIIDSGYAQVDGLFQLSPWLFMLLCPALTMRLFSEERQSGMWDLIRTKPISLTRIVLGKYFAAWTLVLIGLLPCFVHYFVVAYMAELIAVYALFRTGFSLVAGVTMKAVLNFVIIFIRLYYTRLTQSKFSLSHFARRGLVPVSGAALLTLMVSTPFLCIAHDAYTRLAFTPVVIAISLIATYYVGMNSSERKSLHKLIDRHHHA